ncbi:hypothetical protein ACIGN6_31450 [Streptomyces sp. NPDC053792]|uniref:hypothetical protein n=1 Tax=Streptomyces sp. NPDC053792 TaxID=3365716 RepID=UPI0037D16576
MKTVLKTAAVSTALACCAVIPTASPAAADSSSCTHHWSGPQICIRLEGRNNWNSATAIWTNPPKNVKSRTVWLTVNGRRYGGTERATKVGKTISYRWSSWQTDTGSKICAHFKDIDRVACEETKYIGNRTNF